MASKAVRLARLQAELSRSQWAQIQIARRRQTESELKTSGLYLGYDAEAEAHQIVLLSGDVVSAESITTAGNAIGDPVVVSHGGTTKFKSMPR